MMKQSLFAYLLALLLTLTFVGCQSGDGGEETSAPTPAVTLVADGKSDYTVIVPNKASYEYDVAEELVAAIREGTGVTLPILKDRFERTGKEILIGVTNRPEQGSLSVSFLGAQDYALHLEGETPLLLGNSRAALREAVNYFLSFLNAETGTLAVDDRMNKTYLGEYIPFFSEGHTEYRIVVPAADQYAYALAEELQSKLRDRFGCIIGIYKDFSDPVSKEILIGNTNREESQAVLDGLTRQRDYAVAMVGDKPVINGTSYPSLLDAYDSFVSTFVTSHAKGTETVYFDKHYEVRYQHTYGKAENAIESITNKTDRPVQTVDFAVSTVFSPTEGRYYNNMSGFVECGGKYYVFWVTSPEHEDQAGQHVLCSVSEDMKTWSEPITVKGVTMGESSEKVMWAYPYAYGGKLYCGISLFEYRPEDIDENGRGDWENVINKEWILLTSEDGKTWVPGHAPSGYVDYLYAARHSQDFADLARKGASYFSEGSLYHGPDGEMYALFRSVIYPGEANDGGMNYKWGCVSYDGGVTWSKAYRTHLSDAPQMSCSGNLPDGRAYYVGSPASSYERACLMLYLSEDGVSFDEQYVLYEGIAYETIKPGIAKNPGYHYPRSIVTEDAIHVAYTLNKESLQVISIPLSALGGS